jgi:Tol biopolymer transport system component
MSHRRLVVSLVAPVAFGIAACSPDLPELSRPALNPEFVVTSEDTPISIDVLANDTPSGPFPLNLTEASADVGTAVITGNSVLYQPPLDYHGDAWITYSVVDGAYLAHAKAHVTITSVDDAPVASDVTTSTAHGAPVTVTLTGTDVEGDALTFVIFSQPSGGTLDGSSPTFTYHPRADFSGEDSFAFQAYDGETYSGTAEAHIDVSTGGAPVADDQWLTLDEDASVSFTLDGHDPDGQPLTYWLSQWPANGSVTGDPSSTLHYQPSANFHGSDTVVYAMSDGELTGYATVHFTVTSKNDAPVAKSQALSMFEDSSLTIWQSGNDVDGGTLTYAIVSPPATGTLTTSGSAWIYKPAPNAHAPVSFTFQVSDGLETSAPATVTIDVMSVEDPPVATAQVVNLQEDAAAAAITLAGSDADGDAVTFAVTGGPLHGTLTGTPPLVSYKPAPDWNGTDTLKFTAISNGMTSPAATVTINVAAVNDAPVATAQGLTTDEDGAFPIKLSGTDVEGSFLSYEVVAAPQKGTLNGVPPNVVYTPKPDMHGTDAFSFRVSDGALWSAPAVIAIELVAIDDAPVAIDDVAFTEVGAAVTIDATANDTDPDFGDEPTVIDVTAAAHGTATIVDNAVHYTPAPGFRGTEVLTYTLGDDGGLTATAKIRVGVGEFPSGIRSERIAEAPTTTNGAIAISDDGRFVAFTSDLALSPADTNALPDVYVYDRRDEHVELISVAASGAVGNAGSGQPAISGDGRYVAFASSATNLVAGDANEVVDVFVRDRVAKTTVRVSVASDGTEANAMSVGPSISADGRHVAFASDAFSLVPNDVNGTGDVFVRDLDDGITERVSVSSAGVEADLGALGRAGISADGQVIAFLSTATNLVAGDSNGVADIFVRDRVAHVTQRMSVSSTGTQGDKASSSPRLSADGRFVAFLSAATTLVPNDTNTVTDAFFHDRTTGNTTRMSVPMSTYDGASGLWISGDGRYVAIEANGTIGGAAWTHQIFVRDQFAGTSALVSATSTGAPGNGASTAPVISRNGRYIGFLSSAQNLSSASPSSYWAFANPL